METKARLARIFLAMVIVPKWILWGCVSLFFFYSPLVSMGVSVWRLARRDYSADVGGSKANKAKLNAALDIFYALALFHSFFVIYWMNLALSSSPDLNLVLKQCGFGKWGPNVIGMYNSETERKLKKDGKLPDKWNLITYGVGLLQSASEDDHLWGARVLDELFDKDVSVREELLPSRLSIQNLISMIGTDKIENSERAARILARLASGLRITQFPGTTQSICYLLERSSCKQYFEPQVTLLSEYPEQRLPNKKDPHGSLEISEHEDDAYTVPTYNSQERRKFLDPYRHPYEHRGAKELISQGLLILERLTQDEENCTEITKHQRLLSKITSPLRSREFLSNEAMVEMVSKSLTVVTRLLTSPGEGATKLRQQLASNKEAVSNLMAILKTYRKGDEQLHQDALEILTELALDDSFKNLDFNKLFKALLKIFLGKDASNAIVESEQLDITTIVELEQVGSNTRAESPAQKNTIAESEQVDSNTIAESEQVDSNTTAESEQVDRERPTRLRGKAGEALARLLTVRIATARRANVADILSKRKAINILKKVQMQPQRLVQATIVQQRLWKKATPQRKLTVDSLTLMEMNRNPTKESSWQPC
nr:unnamed protein product [Digitaria exilis]